MSHKSLSKKDAPKNINNNEMVMAKDDLIVSKTDKKGFITYCNKTFIEFSGYIEDELIGANHNIIRHPDMPRVAFKLCWDLIQQKQEFFGYVKNLRKDGGFYWVFAYITADINEKGDIIGYSSFRKKPSQEGIDAVIPLYKTLLEKEQIGGMQESQRYLNEFLKSNNTTYDELISSLQN